MLLIADMVLISTCAEVLLELSIIGNVWQYTFHTLVLVHNIIIGKFEDFVNVFAITFLYY